MRVCLLSVLRAGLGNLFCHTHAGFKAEKHSGLAQYIVAGKEEAELVALLDRGFIDFPHGQRVIEAEDLVEQNLAL